jgi:hypothetical protein
MNINKRFTEKAAAMGKTCIKASLACLREFSKLGVIKNSMAKD